MCLSKTKTLAAVLLITAAVANAQFNTPGNARTEALGGAPLADITDVFRYPALMTGYTGHIQATWGGGVAAVKSVGDMFSVGLLANQGLMAPAVVDAAVGRLNTYFSASPNEDFTDNFNIPHLLLGFDLGTIKFGADVFFEYAGYGLERKTGSDTYKESGSFVNPGVRLSTHIDLGAAEILAKFGFGFPSVNANLDNAAATKLSSENGSYIETGAEAFIPLSGIDLIAGLDYTRSDHRFKIGDNNDQDAYCNSKFSMYLGGEFNVLETAAAAFSYKFERWGTTLTRPDDDNNYSRTAPLSHAHIFSAGMENVWNDAWIFDSAALRAGARYRINSNHSKESSGDNKLNVDNQARHQGISPTIGAGVSKGFLTLDLSLLMGNTWAGAFSGPPVGLVTGTIKF